MRSPNTYNLNKRGFTLIELVVVMGILAAIMSLGLLMSMDVYRGFSYRNERDVVVSMLQKARSRSMNNINQTPWGVCYVAPHYIVFKGTVCTPGSASNETLPASPSAAIAGLYLPGVVFTQLSGTTTATTTSITQNGKTSAVSINYEGTIIW